MLLGNCINYNSVASSIPSKCFVVFINLSILMNTLFMPCISVSLWLHLLTAKKYIHKRIYLLIAEFYVLDIPKGNIVKLIDAFENQSSVQSEMWNTYLYVQCSN